MGYTNSALVCHTHLNTHHSGQRNHAIDTVTIHCTVGQCSVESLGNLFAQPEKRASSNYGIGADGRIGLYVEEKNCSWCSSNAANDQRAVTIEVSSDAAEPYAVTGKAYAALLSLLTDLCRRNGIEALVWSTDKNERVNHLHGCNMTVHRDYANKSCPGTYLYERHAQIAAAVNERLKGENHMTQADFNAALNSYLAALRDNDSGTWSASARAWAIENGIVSGIGKLPDGSANYAWGAPITREQAVMMLCRLAQLAGKA